MEIKTFGVVGAGQMGNGIAQVAAMSGLDVIMNDIKEEFVQRGLDTISKNLDRSVAKAKKVADFMNHGALERGQGVLSRHEGAV